MPDARDPDKVAITVYIHRDVKAAVQARAAEKAAAAGKKPDTLTDIVDRALRRYAK